MLKDNIKNCEKYYKLNEKFEKAFEFLKTADFSKEGKIEIDGDNIYASVQSYQTKEPAQCRYEAHRKYIDIQYIVEGKEKIGCIDICDTTDLELYDKEHDVVFLEKKGKENILCLMKGNFVIFYPNDAHKPCMKSTSKTRVLKTVIKIKI